MAYDLVVIGVSAGGLDALCTLMSGLPADFALAVVIVQHRSKDSDALCEVLQDCSDFPLHEVLDKDSLAPGHIYIAPADYHLLVEKGHFSLSTDEPERYSRPSIDVTFMSAADSYGPRAIGIVLTGANADGSAGLRRIVERGGHAIVQDPATAEVAVMPRAALRAVPEAEVLPLAEIAGRLRRLQAAPAARAEKPAW